MSQEQSIKITPQDKRLSPAFAPGELRLMQIDDLPYYRAAITRLLMPIADIVRALPPVFFFLESVMAAAAYKAYGDSDGLLKFLFNQLLAVNMTCAGLMHFAKPLLSFYSSMVPSFLPFGKKFWIFSTGIALVFGGLGVMFPPTQQAAAWLLVTTLVVMFPGNVACVFMEHPRKVVCGGSLVASLVRLPFQATLIMWAFWFTSDPVPLPAF